LIFEDSTMIITDYSTSSKYFVFENIPYGNYYIKCIISDNSSEYGNYFNTWASHDPNNQHVSWEDAEVFLLNSEFEIANINLKEPDVVFSGGAGVISGEITNTMGINTSEQLLYLLNDTKNFVSAIYPSPTGSFRFDSLIMGTYYIRPELLNITSMDIEIQLNVDAPTVDDVQISIDSNHYFTSVNKINSNIFDFNVYPNPTDGFINLDIVTKNESKLIVNIYNMLGVSLYTNSLSIDEIQILKLDISEYKTGLYFISVSDGYNVSVKKILKN
ncbi:MAG: T9SS type A sorting domain-containing protein, partial [Bacteroidales bacterium]|nr:T9SS type A sorting domain-containing protein [Bacteroidales bacterium]